ncbi:MAG TPA: FxsA family protein, partial [Lacipirellulaceae bacterium]|nr:FxsA family protein [Lacipirellulaceae bacterium]
SQLVQGVLPAAEMFDGLLIGAAGVLLLIPGILSDILGIALLLPPTRKLVRRGLMHAVRKRFRIQVLGRTLGDGPPARGGDQIIDARVVNTRVIE